MLNTIKEIYLGLERLGNERVTCYNSLKSFVLMWMVETESEDSYVNRIHSNIETLILSGEKGALLYSKTLVSEYKANPTEK